MPRLLGLGLLAAALFSVTFVLNRSMSLAGGHWAWSAALRYVDMAVLLMLWIALRHGPVRLLAVLRLFRLQSRLWLLAGGIGFGVFYTGICYAASHAPGWIVAASWQMTILATPLVMAGFGARVPLRGMAFCGIIVLGILVLNAQRIAEGVAMAEVLTGVLPVLVAAFAYPFGNQIVNRLRHAGGDAADLLADPAAAVLLLTLGALPLFAGLILLTAPPPPGTGQLISTGIVALVAGGLATPLFLYARNLSSDPLRIAAVDATQAGEVGFALLGEMALLGATAPDPVGWLGLLAVMGGLAGFMLRGAAPEGKA
ncbi:multidrug resistance efflux transporter family protein [Rhodovastum atsumiense]|uniref:Multidrug resistance efflux transporter family protein n=1 Tax=Rhodovastum atsumiense TaxID=504468 RepID=A0A5M6ILF6_9PROT|nr:multidrug resistance efflux transporter family protein [Rhodovastum atsumiense]KAA5609096.1 multidrug resistance efflux transporter family protein [Rhodovastum atsumiense]